MHDGTSTAADPPAQAAAEAIEFIRAEHRALAGVVLLLRQFANEIRHKGREPDFAFLCALLHYVDAFPQRFHHPKEDDYLFSALRRRHAAAAPLLGELQSEHLRGAELLRNLEKALIRYQGGVPGAAELFCAEAERFAGMQVDHVRKEEEEVLPLARSHLAAEDWRAMRAAFADHDDPLFGARPRQEFERLRLRIMHLAPRRMKQH